MRKDLTALEVEMYTAIWYACKELQNVPEWKHVYEALGAARDIFSEDMWVSGE